MKYNPKEDDTQDNRTLKISITGPLGVGKSTIISLIHNTFFKNTRIPIRLRVFDTDEGFVLNHSMRTLPREYLDAYLPSPGTDLLNFDEFLTSKGINLIEYNMETIEETKEQIDERLNLLKIKLVCFDSIKTHNFYCKPEECIYTKIVSSMGECEDLKIISYSSLDGREIPSKFKEYLDSKVFSFSKGRF